MPKKSPKPMPAIGIWAGSSPSTAREVREGLQRLREIEREPVVPPEVRKNWTRQESKARPFLAGPDSAKVAAFLKLWRDPYVHSILPVRGGYGTIRLLSELDRKLTPPNGPKTIWGFSDLTCIQNWLWARFGLPWVHSPMLSSSSFSRPERTEAQAWRACLDPFSEGQPIEHGLRVVNRPRGTPTKIRGPLLGGNLACFVSLLGTRFEPRPRSPFLFFLEEIDEYPRRIDRWLHQLSESRFFERCRGVVLGHLTNCGNAETIVRLWAEERGLLLVKGLRAGHDRPNLPVAMGVPATLALQKNGAAHLSVPNLTFE